MPAREVPARTLRLLLSGVLVLPVCLTGVVTAFQLQDSQDSAESVASTASAGVREAAADESVVATPILPVATAVPAIASDAEVVPGTATIPPKPAPDPTPEGTAQQLREQRANREYFARLTADGLLPGRVQYVDGRSRGLIPAKRVAVSFIQNGKLVSQAKPGVDGFFQAAGLVPGFYTVVASGLDGVMTFGIEIQPALNVAPRPNPEGRVKEDVRAQIEGERFRLQQTESDAVRDAESFLRIDAVLVPPRDVPVVKRIFDVYVKSPMRALQSTGVMPTAAALKNARQVIQEIKGSNALPVSTQIAKERVIKDRPAIATVQGGAPKTIRGSWGTPLRMPIFYQHSNGSVGGRLTYFQPDVANRDVHFRAPVEGGSVYFVRNGAVIEQATTDHHGRFQIARLPVGDYTFVSGGSAGVSAFGVSVLPHSPDAANDGRKVQARSVSSIRLAQAGGEGKATAACPIRTSMSIPVTRMTSRPPICLARLAKGQPVLVLAVARELVLVAAELVAAELAARVWVCSVWGDLRGWRDLPITATAHRAAAVRSPARVHRRECDVSCRACVWAGR